MKRRKQKITKGDNFRTDNRAELEGMFGVQSFLWIKENEITSERITRLLENCRVPNGTHGGVRDRNGKLILIE